MSVLRKPIVLKKDLKIMKKERLIHPDKTVRARLTVLWATTLDFNFSATQLAMFAGISQRSVFEYIRLYEEGGLEELMNIERYKPTSKLEGYRDLIADEFDSSPPASIKEARIRIKKLTGIRRSETQVRRFLKSIGMKLLKPVLIPMSKDDVDVKAKTKNQQEFAKTQLEPLLKEAENHERKVLFMDACHVQLACIVGFLWCFAKKYIKAMNLRGRINIIGACSAYGDDIICDISADSVNQNAVALFLVKVRNRIKEGKVTLVLDNASYQKNNYIRETADKLGIELLYLPVASPNLNIIERLWKFAKKTFLANEIFCSLDELEKHLRKSFSTLKNKYKAKLKTLLTLNFQYFDSTVQFVAA